jgi:acetyl/propionyl-CoA carboxylase alpha subunit
MKLGSLLLNASGWGFVEAGERLAVIEAIKMENV